MIGTTYKIEIDITQNWWWIRIDGLEVFSGSIGNHELLTDQICWLFPSWIDVDDNRIANASVANILITNGMYNLYLFAVTKLNF